MISTSPIKISCVIASDRVPDAVRALHESFELGDDAGPARGADRRPSPPAGRRAHERLPRRSPRRDRGGRLDRARGARRALVPGRRAASRSPPSARPASACRSPAARSSVRALSEESIDGLDLVISSAGGAVSAEWAPRLIEAGAVVVDNTSYWRMHDDVPLVVSEVNPEAADAPPRADRQPELLDHADGRRAEADPRRGRDRAPRDLHLPVGLAGPASARSRSCATSRARCSPASAPSRSVYPHPIAFNVLPQVETFKDGDDYTTEERKMMAETRKILGAGERARDLRDLRAGARLRRPLGVGQRADARAARSRRVPRAARRRARRRRPRRPGRRASTRWPPR